MNHLSCFQVLPSYKVLTLLLIFLYTFPIASQNVEGCGMTDADQDWDIPFSDGTILSGFDTEYQIPIHLHFFNDVNQNPPQQDGLELEFAQVGVDILNQYFPKPFNFYICQVDYYNEQIISNRVITYNNFVFDDNAINVYVRSTGSAFATPNQGVLMTPNNFLTVTFAHEMGHYFTLRHPHFRTIYDVNNCSGDNRYIALDPDGNCLFNLCDPDQTYCSTCDPGEATCECRSDALCDTPVDPGNSYCSDASDSNTPCVITIDGTTYTYTPLYNNIMSYYTERTAFTAQQQEQMIQKLLNDYLFLIDEDEPDCEDLDINTNIFVAETGNIERVSYSGGSPSFDPLPNWKVKVDPQEVSGSCQPSTDVQGVYENRTAFPCGFIVPVYTGIEDVRVDILNEVNISQTRSVVEGVTTFDMIQIQKHILTTELLSNPYSMIAADVSGNGVISTLDLIKIRKVILTIDDSFSDVPSWRLLPRYAFNSGDTSFEAEFNADPFSATWDITSTETRGYEPNSDGYSYLDAVTLDFLTDIPTYEENWSFMAIKTGDVNFNANLEGVQGPPYGGEGDGSVTVEVINENTAQNTPLGTRVGQEKMTFDDGDQFSVTFQLDSGIDLEGYQLLVEFPDEKLEAIQIRSGNLPEFSLENFNLAELSDGIIRGLWLNTTSQLSTFQSDSKLFIVDFEVKQDEVSPADLFSINSSWSAIYDGNGPINSTELMLSISDVTNKNKLNSIYPNPASGVTSFEFKLDEAASVSIIVSDAAGNSISHNAHYGEGEHQHVMQGLNGLLDGQLNYQISLGSEQHSGIIFNFQ